MSIYKAVIQVTVLFDSNIDSVEQFQHMSLPFILDECNDGHMMGRRTDISLVEVPNDEVPAEEKALGGDGTFFADPDELTHARLDAEESERPDRACDPTCSRRFSPAAECDCSRSE